MMRNPSPSFLTSATHEAHTPLSTRFALRRDCCSLDSSLPWRKQLARLITSDIVGNVSTALVIINLVIMCMGYAGMNEEYAAQLERASTTITLIFMAEMAAKLVGLGCAGGR